MKQQDAPASSKRHASLKELAEHLGLSQTTVSRVMNNAPGSARISASTRDRVLAAAVALNYKPNELARGLRSKRSQIVGVIVPEISDGYSTSVLSGVEDTLLHGGYFYFVVSHRHNPELLHDYPSLLLSRAVEGVIAVDTPLEGVLPVPVVCVSGHDKGNERVNIELDHNLAVQYALEHLKQLGHRKIAFIKGQSFSSDTQARWNAITHVAEALDLTIDPELVVQLDGDGVGLVVGKRAAQELLSRKKPFTAIFAFNDHSAIGAILTLREAGIGVPSQVSVIGFDDIPSAETNNPALTTVRQPLQEMGRVAASTLLEMLQSQEDGTGRTIRVLPALVERESTAQAPLQTFIGTLD